MDSGVLVSIERCGTSDLSLYATDEPPDCYRHHCWPTLADGPFSCRFLLDVCVGDWLDDSSGRYNCVGHTGVIHVHGQQEQT